MIKINSYYNFGFISFFLAFNSFALDTTHTHRLVTDSIASVIELNDNDENYLDIYIELSDDLKVNVPVGVSLNQRLYWCTDFDPMGLAAPLLNTAELRVQYLLKDIIPPPTTSTTQ